MSPHHVQPANLLRGGPHAKLLCVCVTCWPPPAALASLQVQGRFRWNPPKLTPTPNLISVSFSKHMASSRQACDRNRSPSATSDSAFLEGSGCSTVEQLPRDVQQWVRNAMRSPLVSMRKHPPHATWRAQHAVSGPVWAGLRAAGAVSSAIALAFAVGNGVPLRFIAPVYAAFFVFATNWADLMQQLTDALIGTLFACLLLVSLFACGIYRSFAATVATYPAALFILAILTVNRTFRFKLAVGSYVVVVLVALQQDSEVQLLDIAGYAGSVVVACLCTAISFVVVRPHPSRAQDVAATAGWRALRAALASMSTVAEMVHPAPMPEEHDCQCRSIEGKLPSQGSELSELADEAAGSTSGQAEAPRRAAHSPAALPAADKSPVAGWSSTLSADSSQGKGPAQLGLIAAYVRDAELEAKLRLQLDTCKRNLQILLHTALPQLPYDVRFWTVGIARLCACCRSYAARQSGQQRLMRQWAALAVQLHTLATMADVADQDMGPATDRQSARYQAWQTIGKPLAALCDATLCAGEAMHITWWCQAGSAAALQQQRYVQQRTVAAGQAGQQQQAQQRAEAEQPSDKMPVSWAILASADDLRPARGLCCRRGRGTRAAPVHRAVQALLQHMRACRQELLDSLAGLPWTDNASGRTLAAHTLAFAMLRASDMVAQAHARMCEPEQDPCSEQECTQAAHAHGQGGCLGLLASARRHASNRFASRQIWLQSARVTFALCLASLLVFLQVSRQFFVSPAWAAYAVVFTASSDTGSTWRSSAWRVWGTVLGSVVAYAAGVLFSPNKLLLSIACTVWAAVLLGYSVGVRASPASISTGYIAAYTLILLLLGPALNSERQARSAVIQRVELNFLGIGILLLVFSFLVPVRASDMVVSTLSEGLHQAGDANVAIFRQLHETARGCAPDSGASSDSHCAVRVDASPATSAGSTGEQTSKSGESAYQASAGGSGNETARAEAAEHNSWHSEDTQLNDSRQGDATQQQQQPEQAAAQQEKLERQQLLDQPPSLSSLNAVMQALTESRLYEAQKEPAVARPPFRRRYWEPLVHSLHLTCESLRVLHHCAVLYHDSGRHEIQEIEMWHDLVESLPSGAAVCRDLLHQAGSTARQVHFRRSLGQLLWRKRVGKARSRRSEAHAGQARQHRVTHEQLTEARRRVEHQAATLLRVWFDSDKPSCCSSEVRLCHYAAVYGLTKLRDAVLQCGTQAAVLLAAQGQQGEQVL